MTQAPKPRDTLGRLIERAKDDSGKEWLDIALGSGISESTIQSWLNGNVKKPPLRPVAHLAVHLGIAPDEFVKAALADYRPPTASPEAEATDEGADGAVADAARVLPAQPRERKPDDQTPRSRRAGQPSPDE